MTSWNNDIDITYHKQYLEYCKSVLVQINLEHRDTYNKIINYLENDIRPSFVLYIEDHLQIIALTKNVEYITNRNCVYKKYNGFIYYNEFMNRYVKIDEFLN